MLSAHVRGNPVPVPIVAGDGAVLPAGTVWIDLLTPTREEELFIERVTGLSLPTREDMVEIEPSSRFYLEAGAIFLTTGTVSTPIRSCCGVTTKATCSSKCCSVARICAVDCTICTG